jgi:tetratricopeptide (TPR) repeat protein
MTGLLGTGKTSLVRHYLAKEKKKAKWYTCVRILNITTILGAKSASLEAALEEASLTWSQYEVIVWDDLHLLKPEVRYLIIQFIKGIESSTQHILISEENLSLELGFEVPAFTLSGFTQQEVEEFLEKNHSKLEASTVFKKTGGLPLLLQMSLQVGQTLFDPQIWVQNVSTDAQNGLRLLSLLPEGLESSVCEKIVASPDAWDELKRKNMVSSIDSNYVLHAALQPVLEKWSQSDAAKKQAAELLRENLNLNDLTNFRLALATDKPQEFENLIMKITNSELESLSSTALAHYQSIIIKSLQRVESPELLYRLKRLELASYIYLGERKLALKMIQQNLTPEFFDQLTEEKTWFGYEAIYWLMRSGQTEVAALPVSLLINRAKTPVRELLTIEQALPFVATDYAQAIQILNRSLGVLKNIQTPHIQQNALAQAYYQLAISYYGLKDFENSRKYYIESQKQYQAIKKPYFSAFCSLNLGWIYYYSRRWDDFLQELTELKAITKQFGYQYLAIGVHLFEALAAFEEGRESESIRLVSLAESQARRMQIKRAWEDCAFLKAKILLSSGQLERATQILGELKSTNLITQNASTYIHLLEKYEYLTLDELLDAFPQTDKVDDPFWKSTLLTKGYDLKNWKPVTPREQLLDAELSLSKAQKAQDENLFKHSLMKIEHWLNRFPEPKFERIALYCAKAQQESQAEARQHWIEMAELEWERWNATTGSKNSLRQWIDSLKKNRTPPAQFKWKNWIFQKEEISTDYQIITHQNKFTSSEKPSPSKTGASVDETAGEVFFKGKKITEFSKKPVLRQILIKLLESHPSSLSKAALSAAVWGESYSPQVHDSRIYTSVQRIRDLINDDCIENWEQGYRWNPKIAFQLVKTPFVKNRTEDRIQNLILDSLRKRSKMGDGWMKKSELAEVIETTDSTLKRALAALLDEALIIREGQGPAVKYKWKN